MQLPVAAIADVVNQTLAERQAVVITAPPGAGKSTLLPLTILSEAPAGSKILMLEPRRLAARQIAERMAELMDENGGAENGEVVDKHLAGDFGGVADDDVVA